MDSFYVSLSSDASKSVYKKNNASLFMNIFPKRIDVSDNWEVALMQITIPMTLHNVRGNRCVAWVYAKGSMEQRCIIDAGVYVDTKNILEQLETAFNGLYKFSMKEGKVLCTPGRPESYIRFSYDLSLILGIKRGFEFIQGEVHADFPPNVNLGMPSRIRVLSSIVKQQIVGDKFLPLFAEIVPELNFVTYGSTSTVRFDTPYYHTLLPKSMDTISVYLTDMHEVLCSFAAGTTTALLHFRRAEEK
jgi:hypothetical protein